MPLPAYQKHADQGTATPIHATNLSVVSEANASLEVKQLYEHFRQTFGRPEVPGILQCFATHPPLLQHMMGLAETMLFSAGALGRANKEMLATFVSAQNHCDYCADSHGFFLRMNGGSSELFACFNRVVNAFGLPSQNLLAMYAASAAAASVPSPEQSTASVHPGGNP
jgi:AhpD family alkylhydroperoxidase